MIQTDEPIFGLAVVGSVHPPDADECGCKTGDCLML